MRHRAAELELNANSSHSAGSFVEAPAEPSTSRSTPTVDASLLNASSSDRFWRTLMNAAENLRALSNIGRSLNNPTQSASTSSRPSGPSLDQDARMRIQLLSRHIENMQRICRSHLEMTRHRRQVFREICVLPYFLLIRIHAGVSTAADPSDLGRFERTNPLFTSLR